MGLDMSLMERKSNNELKYWRKANQIRRWFVEHIDDFDFNDNCGCYDVSKDLLEELKEDIEYVLSGKTEEEKLNRAYEKIPTCSGFFFGSTDYDEDYFFTLEHTLESLNEILSNWSDEDDIYYTEWW